MKKENETYKFIKFVKSDKAGKKYTAILKNKNTGGEKRVHFGDSTLPQYRDSTGVGAWSHKDTNDKERRRLYHLRHKGEGDPSNFPNPGFWSSNFLW